MLSRYSPFIFVHPAMLPESGDCHHAFTGVTLPEIDEYGRPLRCGLVQYADPTDL